MVTELISTRVDAETARRIQSLSPGDAKRARSAVLRRAIALGLAVLETERSLAELPPIVPGRPRAKRAA